MDNNAVPEYLKIALDMYEREKESMAKWVEPKTEEKCKLILVDQLITRHAEEMGNKAC